MTKVFHLSEENNAKEDKIKHVQQQVEYQYNIMNWLVNSSDKF